MFGVILFISIFFFFLIVVEMLNRSSVASQHSNNKLVKQKTRHLINTIVDNNS